MQITAGTRRSRLALWQTAHVLETLGSHWPGLATDTISFETTGDRIIDQPLPEIGGKGLFTAELERALLDREIDIAVHSLKDLPTEDADGLTVGAVLSRHDVRDVLVAPDRRSNLTALPRGARIGTSSPRRMVQIKLTNPGVDVVSIRGNVPTRIDKVMRGDYDAAVMAAAGLTRLDLTDNIAEYLDTKVMLPAPGQGALAVQCRADDDRTLELLAPINNKVDRAAVTCERNFLHALGGGCSTPVAAFARRHDDGNFYMDALVASPDGQKTIRLHDFDSDPVTLARALAEQALSRGARKLIGHGS